MWKDGLENLAPIGQIVENNYLMSFSKQMVRSGCLNILRKGMNLSPHPSCGLKVGLVYGKIFDILKKLLKQYSLVKQIFLQSKISFTFN